MRFLKNITRWIVRTLILFQPTRKAANGIYNLLSWRQKQWVHTKLSKFFRNRTIIFSDGDWVVRLGNTSIRIPISQETLWLDWDHAMSVAGHDVEVKQTYIAFLKSENRPRYFLDIGANYGIHTLIFLTHGVDAIAFEPNSECCKGIEALCTYNDVEAQVENVALGAESGTTVLHYPERDPWLGSVSQYGELELAVPGSIIAKSVAQHTLDTYLSKLASGDILIKIDTEGSELDVLCGGRNLIESRQPFIIFESFQGGSNRSELVTFFTSSKYAILDLPFDPAQSHEALSETEFLGSVNTNFIAIPKARALTTSPDLRA